MLKIEETKPDKNNIFTRTEYFEDKKVVKTIKLIKMNKKVIERKNNWVPFGEANNINNNKVTFVSEQEIFMDYAPFNDHTKIKKNDCDCGGVHFSVPCRKYRENDSSYIEESNHKETMNKEMMNKESNHKYSDHKESNHKVSNHKESNHKESNHKETMNKVSNYKEKELMHIEKNTNTITNTVVICKICNGDHWTRICPTSRGNNDNKIIEDKKDTITDNKQNTTVQITNLSADVLEYELYYLFSLAGAIKCLSIVKKFDSHESKGVAIITYNTLKETENAIKMYNNYGLNNLLLKVNLIN